MSDDKNLPSEDVALSLIQCFYCNTWVRPQYMVDVLFNQLVQKVCVKCRRQLLKIQKEMDLEMMKQKEDEEVKNASPEALGFGK